MRKRQTAGIMLTVGILAAGLTGCAGTNTGVPMTVTVEQPENNVNTVTVTGKEEVRVVPDMAQVVYGIHTQAKDAGTCQQKNGESLDQAIEVLKGLGIQETSIQTSSYDMNPIRNWNSSTQEITGYEMNTRLTVTDIPLEQLGKILAGSVDAGVNQVDSVSYFSSKYDESYQQALELAVAQARKKADTLAAAGGRTVSSMLAVREDGYQPETRYTAARNMASSAMKQESAVADMAVMPGEISVEAQVSVDFRLE
ncbi:MAG: SIMPL domain-containing protein [Eubacteriales bacterium]|nr:SIMPL domain-containing protein [Eubacteriales bacterium]